MEAEKCFWIWRDLARIMTQFTLAITWSESSRKEGKAHKSNASM